MATKYCAQCEAAKLKIMIRRNKVSGGMILKLEAAKRALAGGVAEVRIVGGTAPRALLAAANGPRMPWHAGSARDASSSAKAAYGAAR